jgi:hypothetical protein
MTLALLVQTCRYAATNFGQAKAGLPVAVSGPAAPRLVGLELPRHFALPRGRTPRGRIKSQTLRWRSGFRLWILTPVRARPARTGDPGSRCAHARKAAQIVKERWFLLPGQPQQSNHKSIL